MRLPARQALKKVGKKGKREERETLSFSHFPFIFHCPPPPRPLLPLPFFVPATQAISKLARPRGPSTGTPTSVYDCRHYSHGIGDVSQA